MNIAIVGPSNGCETLCSFLKRYSESICAEIELTVAEELAALPAKPWDMAFIHVSEQDYDNYLAFLAGHPADCDVLLWAEDDHLARQGLRSHSCDFLVLPLDDERFLSAMKKCSRWADALRSIRCSSGSNARKLRCIEVQYVESFGHSCTIHCRQESFAVNFGLARVQEQLGSGFIRCHKSYVVNIRYIAERRDRELLLRDGTVLPLSATCAETVTAALEDYMQRLACFIGGGAE